MRVRKASLGCLLLLAGLVAGCGDDGEEGEGGVAPEEASTGPSGAGSSTLSVTREDGTTFETGDLEVTCDGTGEDTAITVTSPEGRDPDGSTSFLLIQIPLDGAVGDHALPWKATVDDTTSAAVFVYDSDTGNELSSDQTMAAGTVSITGAECGDQPRFAADLDVTLDSEKSDGSPGQVAGQINLGS